MTPSSLAHAIGVTEGAVRQLEIGQSKAPSFMVGLLMARELEVDPEYLAFGDAGAPEPATATLKRDAQIVALERRVKALERAVDALRHPANRRKQDALTAQPRTGA